MRMFVIALVLLLWNSDSFAAGTNYFIPNHYQGRRNLNRFTAVAWSERNEVGVVASHSKNKQQEDDVDSGETSSRFITPYAFYRVNENINTELAVNYFELVDRSPTNPDHKTNDYLIMPQIGYEFSEIPFAVSVGLEYSEMESEDEGSPLKSRYKSKTFTPAVGYKLPTDIFVGFGYYHSISEDSNGPTGKYHSYYLGAGQILGDEKNPFATYEAVFSYSNNSNIQNYGMTLLGLYNMAPIQLYGNLNLSFIDGYLNGDTESVVLGVDYPIASFYLAPELTYSRSGWSTELSSSTSWSASGSIELGYRVLPLEIFFRYNQRTSNSHAESGSFISEDDSRGQQMFVGGNYRF
jgi:hypothetical protein